MLSFLEVNGIYFEFTDKEIEDIALGVASGKLDYNGVLQILKNKEK